MANVHSTEQEAVNHPASTLCWKCSGAYPIDAKQCTHCHASNANVDWDAAKRELVADKPSAGDLCPNCRDEELSLRTHRFDEDGGMPDCGWLVCTNCDFSTDPE